MGHGKNFFGRVAARLGRRPRPARKVTSVRARLRVEHLEDRVVLDVGGTLATAVLTGLGPAVGSYTSPSEFVGDGPHGANDVDMYRFEATAGQRLTAATTQPKGGAEADTYLRLFNAGGTQLAFDDDAGPAFYSLISDFVIPADGTYYVGVSAYNNSAYNPTVDGSGTGGEPDSVGDFQLTLTLASGPTEPDPVGETLATALVTPLGPGVGTYTSPAERIGNGLFGVLDVDMYRFQATAGQVLTARTAQPAGGQGADTVLRLFNSAGTELAFNDDAGGGTLYSEIVFTIPSTGTYYMGVSAYRNFDYDPAAAGSGTDGRAGSVGDYTLTLTLAPPTGGTDVGDTLATALVTGLGPASGSFVQPTERVGNGDFGNRDVDIYRFEAATGSVLTARTAQPSGGLAFDSFIRLFNASGTQLAFDDDSGGSLYSLLTFTFTAPGTYYLGVSGFNNSQYNPTVGGSGVAGAVGDYRLTLDLVTPQPGEIRGVKFNDANQNGVQDDGEEGLAGWRIYIDANRNGQFDDGERFAITGEDGSYVLTEVPVGTYTLAEEPQAGWAQTTPAGVPTRTLEDFEGGVLSADVGRVPASPSEPPYIISGGRSSTSFEFSPVAAHDGGFGLHKGVIRDVSTEWIVNERARTQRGDTVSFWFQFAGDVDGRAYFGIGARAERNPNVRAASVGVILAGNTGELIIYDALQGRTTAGVVEFQYFGRVNQAYAANTWYRVEIDWAGDGRITARLFDSDGTTLLNEVASTAPVGTRTEGGIAFRSFGSDKYFDDVTVRSGLPGTYTVTVASGQTVTGLDFGNFFAGVGPAGTPDDGAALALALPGEEDGPPAFDPAPVNGSEEAPLDPSAVDAVFAGNTPAEETPNSNGPEKAPDDPFGDPLGKGPF